MHPKKKKERDRAFAQIRFLFEKAKQTEDIEQSSDFVRKARRLAQKFRLRLPRGTKRLFCSHCYTYFTSSTLRVRTQPGHVVYTCLSCKKYMRFPIRE